MPNLGFEDSSGKKPVRLSLTDAAEKFNKNPNDLALYMMEHAAMVLGMGKYQGNPQGCGPNCPACFAQKPREYRPVDTYTPNLVELFMMETLYDQPPEIDERTIIRLPRSNMGELEKWAATPRVPNQEKNQASRTRIAHTYDFVTQKYSAKLSETGSEADLASLIEKELINAGYSARRTSIMSVIKEYS